MADGYDRYGQEGGDGGSFVMGLLTGTVLGAGLGMLFAPKAGSELRGQLSEQAGNLANTASEGYKKASEAASEGYKKASEAASEGYKKASEAASEWAGKGREAGRDIYDRTKDAVYRGTEEAQRYVREATGATPGSPMPSTSGSSTSAFGPESIRSSAHEETRGHGASGSTGPGGSRRS
jgi:gas vesicle protein